MTDYIYGYRTKGGHTYFSSSWDEDDARLHGNPIRIPVSAIEDLPAPKPVLPTTPGSVIHMRETFWVLNLSDDGHAWWADANSSLEPNAILDRGWDWTLVFDAGASA